MAPPKKQTPFTKFMAKRRKELEAEGREFPGGWKDVAAALNDEWQNMSGEDKSRYAPSGNGNGNGNGNVDYYGEEASKLIDLAFPKQSTPLQQSCENTLEKAVSTGKRLFYDLDPRLHIQGRKLKEVQARERLINLFNVDLERQICEILLHSDSIADTVFILLDFNILCFTDKNVYIPAEIAILAFSLRQGVIDQYATIIDAGSLPVGMCYEANVNRDKLCIPKSPFNEDCSDYLTILGNILHFIQKYTSDSDPAYLFCGRKEMTKVYKCLDWLCNATEYGNKFDFDVCPYEFLLTRLSRVALAKTVIHHCGITDTSKIPVEYVSILEKSIKPQLKPEMVVLRNAIDPEMEPFSINPKHVLTTESEVEQMLKGLKWPQAFLSCLHHMTYRDANLNCVLSKLNRFVYSTIEHFMLPFDVYPIPGLNFPDSANDESETKKRKMLLYSWGLKDKFYPDYITPPEREEQHAAEVKRQVQLDLAARARNDPVEPLEPHHLALLFRPKPPLPEFEFVCIVSHERAKKGKYRKTDAKK